MEPKPNVESPVTETLKKQDAVLAEQAEIVKRAVAETAARRERLRQHNVAAALEDTEHVAELRQRIAAEQNEPERLARVTAFRKKVQGINDQPSATV